MPIIKPIDHTKLHASNKPKEFSLMADAYGETMAREIQAIEQYANEAYSSLADNSKLEPWERHQRRKAQIKKARDERKARWDAHLKQTKRKRKKPEERPSLMSVTVPDDKPMVKQAYCITRTERGQSLKKQ